MEETAVRKTRWHVIPVQSVSVTKPELGFAVCIYATGSACPVLVSGFRFLDVCYEIRHEAVLKVSSISGEYDGCWDFQPKNALDDYISYDFCDIFATREEISPFFQMKFPGRATIHRVRVLAPDGEPERFNDVGLHVGDYTSTKKELTSNPQCGYFSEPGWSSNLH